MNEVTKDRLLELNRRFYARHAGSFSDSRRHPWSGWVRAVGHLGPASGPLRALDLGCGNGRFGSYLAGTGREDVGYHGIDSSRELLAEARRQLSPLVSAGLTEIRLERYDLTRHDLAERLGRNRYHLITLFGVVHHIPGRSSRTELLARLSSLLEIGGILTVSLWRFDRRPRYREKVLPWPSYNRGTTRPIDTSELEEGDHLLTWGGDREVPRYCHLVDDVEVSDLVEGSSLRLLDRFAADGAGADNTYLVLGNRAACDRIPAGATGTSRLQIAPHPEK